MIVNLTYRPYLEAAFQYAEKGFEVFPCAPMRKVPFVGTDGFKNASCDEHVVHAMWTKHPNANIGLRTGVIREGKQLVVIDVDTRNYGDESLSQLTSQYGRLPDTAVVLTSNGGMHLYFAAPADVTFKATLANGIDIKAKNGYVIAPPSIHPSGHRYEWEASSDLLGGFQIADLPEWVIQLAGKHDVMQQSSVINNVCLIDDAIFNEAKCDLYDIPASCSRAVWITVLCALKSLSDSKEMFELFDSWSSTCPAKYCKSGTKKTWNSFASIYGVTIKSLGWIAREERVKRVDISALLNKKENV